MNSARIQQKKIDTISLKGILDILPLNLENRLKIIKIAKHAAYSDSRFSRQQAYLRILILRKARFRKAETNRALDSQQTLVNPSSNMLDVEGSV